MVVGHAVPQAVMMSFTFDDGVSVMAIASLCSEKWARLCGDAGAFATSAFVVRMIPDSSRR
jgi:hypothetical protein